MIQAAHRRELRPERELLLLCARTELDDAAGARIQELLRGPLDWTTVLGYGYRHGTLALLDYHLTRIVATTDGRVPDSVLAELRMKALRATAQALLLTTELKSLMASLEAEGASAVAWKGPVLAHSVYPSPELRTFVDLDLLIRRRDVSRARASLGGRGYVAKPGQGVGEEELFDRRDHTLSMVNQRTGILVDLHWGVPVRYFSTAMDADALCERAEPLAIGDATIPALPPDALLLALSAHGAKHGPFPWPKLKWITDVEALLRAYPEPAWGPLLAHARATGTRRMVLLGICLAQELLHAPTPPAVEAAIGSDRVVRGLVPGILDRLLSDTPTDFTFRERVRFDLAVRERLRDRIRYRSWRLLTSSPRDVPASRLPAALRFLQVPIRLSRLATKYILHPSRIRALFFGSSDAR